MNRGGVGARSLNIELQAVLNPAGERKVERFGWTFTPGDKVMQIENVVGAGIALQPSAELRVGATIDRVGAAPTGRVLRAAGRSALRNQFRPVLEESRTVRRGRG
jgi:hypothetical protein